MIRLALLHIDSCEKKSEVLIRVHAFDKYSVFFFAEAFSSGFVEKVMNLILPQFKSLAVAIFLRQSEGGFRACGSSNQPPRQLQFDRNLCFFWCVLLDGRRKILLYFIDIQLVRSVFILFSVSASSRSKFGGFVSILRLGLCYSIKAFYDDNFQH